MAEEHGKSGRALLRMPRSLHRDLEQAAEREGVSFNQLVVTLLARALGDPTPSAGGDAASIHLLRDEIADLGQRLADAELALFDDLAERVADLEDAYTVDKPRRGPFVQGVMQAMLPAEQLAETRHDEDAIRNRIRDRSDQRAQDAP